jgi:acyl dehydratase
MPEHFEDVTVGEVREFGAYEVTAEEIREFAASYDPQPIHLDEDAPETREVGGLIASGWHTAAMTMRMLVEHLLSEQASGVGTGADDLRWRRPVRPDDVLSVRTEVLGKSDRDDGRGEIRLGIETLNDEGEVVMSMVTRSLVARREG